MNLRNRELTHADKDSAELREFDCGDCPQDHDVSNFLKSDCFELLGDPKRPLIVWLYYDEKDNLVGFSSLGISKWQYPDPQGQRLSVQIIPFLGVARAHAGKGYAKQIVDHLELEAIARQDVSDLLTLFVHVANAAARHIYDCAGFEPYDVPARQSDGELYQKMVLILPTTYVVEENNPTI